MIVLNVKEKGRVVVINPEYTYKSADMFTLWDDCMSFPTLLFTVQRHVCVSLRFMDEHGNEHVSPAGRCDVVRVVLTKSTRT